MIRVVTIEDLQHLEEIVDIMQTNKKTRERMDQGLALFNFDMNEVYSDKELKIQKNPNFPSKNIVDFVDNKTGEPVFTYDNNDKILIDHQNDDKVNNKVFLSGKPIKENIEVAPVTRKTNKP